MPRDDSAIPAAAYRPSSFAWTALGPAVFVVFWSSGFIAAKAGLPYAGPLTFLAVRFAIVVGLIGERGREVKEFIEDILGAEGLARSVVVAARTRLGTPALARIHKPAMPVQRLVVAVAAARV